MTLEDVLAFVRKQEAVPPLASGETVLAHAQGLQQILEELGLDVVGQIAACLFPLVLQQPQLQKQIAQQFGDEVVTLLSDVCKLENLNKKIASQEHGGGDSNKLSKKQERVKQQIEVLRKMLLAFAGDIRVVLILLASTLQALRAYVQQRATPPLEVVRQALDIYAPLANRLGIWQVKWELEDLAFRFDKPEVYRRIARLLDEKRVEREQFIATATALLKHELETAGIVAEVSGRPKHIYSIWKKMCGKGLDFEGLYDVRAFRVIVSEIKDCYTVLGFIHHLWQPIPKEFDDYIAHPKPNGYRSLHTVVTDPEGRAFEVQIRTREMHKFAEFGVAAHWRYKEAGTGGYAGQVSAASEYDAKIAWLRQLLAWKDEAGATTGEVWEQLKQTDLDDHIYVLTPQARVIALPQGSTPVDFAYYLHTDVGHRCRGARLDGAIVPLNTPLQNGQTVEVVTVKQGGPSRDWLMPSLGYLASPRARAKVRAWFNALEIEETLSQGRTLLEKILQREGKTTVNLESLAHKLDFANLEALLIALAKEKIGSRPIEQALQQRPTEDVAVAADDVPLSKPTDTTYRDRRGDGVLVVGVNSLLTQLAKCCRPAPPDEIVGFVTRGKGVSIHRMDCKAFMQLCRRAPERVIDTSWGKLSAQYPVDIVVEATDRQGLLRDCTDVFSRDKINMTAVRTTMRQQVARIQITVEVSDTRNLQKSLAALINVPGVLSARRK